MIYTAKIEQTSAYRKRMHYMPNTDTFEEFTKLLFFGDTETIEPPKNSLYRLKLNGEFVYFII